MSFGIGGGGSMGFALEVTPNIYQAPTKFCRILSENLKTVEDTQWRRPIGLTVDTVGAVAGDVHVEGDVEMEVFEDVLPYFHMCSRANVVKSGVSPNFVYTATPNSNATPAKTMSITVVRNGAVFGYVGCIVSSFKYTVDNGLLKVTFSIIGSDEADETLPTAIFNSTVPFGAGSYNVQIPTATQVFDLDTFEFSVDDNADPQYRLKNTGRGAQFVKYGERDVTISAERDFQDKADYATFRSQTSQSITITATKSVNNSVTLSAPAAIKDTYEIGLSGQGDLLRASISYMGTLDVATSRSYQIAVKTQEDIT